MKCPNIGKFSKCKGDLVTRVEEDGSMYYKCPTCGYSHVKYSKMYVKELDLDAELKINKDE